MVEPLFWTFNLNLAAANMACRVSAVRDADRALVVRRHTPERRGFTRGTLDLNLRNLGFLVAECALLHAALAPLIVLI